MTVKINTHHRIIGIISTKDILHHINIYIFLAQTKCIQSVFCSSINFTTFCQYRRGISASDRTLPICKFKENLWMAKKIIDF